MKEIMQAIGHDLITVVFDLLVELCGSFFYIIFIIFISPTRLKFFLFIISPVYIVIALDV